MDINALKIIKKNIDWARNCKTSNESTKIILVITGSAIDRENWEARFKQTSLNLFGKNTQVLCLEEKTGNKTRAGNFLGTLLAYKQLKAYAAKKALPYRDTVTLAGMIIGRGERISPFTQIEGNRKSAIKVNSGIGMQAAGNDSSLAAIEEALFYFVPVRHYLEKRGFRGILDKWGDETEIPSIDLQPGTAAGNEFSGWDLVKFVSVLEITDELAEQKDWVVFDEDNNLLAQISRNRKEHIIPRLEELNIKPGTDGEYAAGISLGPVAVSYAVLDLACEIFAYEITAENVFFDFDPYFFMAITLPGDEALWKSLVEGDARLREFTLMVPDFFRKVQSLKTRFCREYGRPLAIKTVNLGSDVFWADIGQHKAMAEKYRLLLADSPAGEIARYLENISAERDERQNIIIDSRVSAGVAVWNSVIIGSTITGSGTIKNSVVKQSTLHNPGLEEAFAVLCHRVGNKLVLNAGSGIYGSIGGSDLVLEPGMRSGTLLTAAAALELKAAADTDLRNRAQNYDQAICGNACSFREAYNSMEGTGMAELESRRARLIAALTREEEKETTETQRHREEREY